MVNLWILFKNGYIVNVFQFTRFQENFTTFLQSSYVKVNTRTQKFLFVKFHFPFKSTKKCSRKKRFYILQILNLYLSVTVLFYKLFLFPFGFVTVFTVCFLFCIYIKKKKHLLNADAWSFLPKLVFNLSFSKQKKLKTVWFFPGSSNFRGVVPCI